MNTELIQSSSGDSFLEGFLKNDMTQQNIVQPNGLEQQNLTDILNQPLNELQGQPPLDSAKDDSVSDLEALLKDTESKKEADKNLVIDSEKIFDKLHEAGMVYTYEDGSKPKTIEELIDVVKQTKEQTFQEELDNAWHSKLEALPPSIKTVLSYAEQGVTTVEQLKGFMDEVSNYEQILKLDSKNVNDQKQIVYLHLVNTGMPEEDIQEQIRIFEENKTLEKTADRFLPSLQQVYKTQVEDSYREQAARQEDAQRYVQNNVANVQHFLKNEQTYIPFKISKNHKNEVLRLSAKPIGLDPNFEPVFEYTEHLKRLQNGSEEEYKEFMEIMTFMANRKEYKEKLGTYSSSNSSKEDFKKIAIPNRTSINKDHQEEEEPRKVIRRTASPWSM